MSEAVIQKKIPNVGALSATARKLKTDMDTLGGRVDQLVTTGGEPNVIIAVKNNGTDLEVSGKAVDIGPAIAAAVAQVDLSSKVDKEEGKGLSSNDYTDEDKAKLTGLEIATDEEIEAMLDEIFGTSTKE